MRRIVEASTADKGHSEELRLAESISVLQYNKDHSVMVSAVTILPDGTQLAYISHDNAVKL